MKHFIKAALALILTLCFSLGLCSCGTPRDKVVKIYNWGDYIDPEVITSFEKETGYKVKYVKFETNETMYAKIANGNTDYDVIVPSDYMIEKMISENMLEKIVFSNIDNYKYINKEFKDLAYDPTNEYSVPYMWGTLGILYNKKMVNGTIDSWTALWDEQYSGNIMMYNSSRDSIGITLMMLGYSLNSTDDKELDEAKQKLISQIPLVSGYVVDEVKDKMIGGEAALALAWAGDATYCVEKNPDLDYVIPKEGSNIFFDAMCIPKGCGNKEGAQAFINYMCKPETSALNASYIGYSTPENEAKLLMGEQGESPIAYPDVTKYRLEVFKDVGSYTKVYDKMWTEILAAIDN